jgi:hypothetical protein
MSKFDQGLPSYHETLTARFWHYQEERFPDWARWFEKPYEPNGRPPVFLKGLQEYNVIHRPRATEKQRNELMNEIPSNLHHRWFRSMTSSQALALSILGNLKISNRLDILERLKDDEGCLLFESVKLSPQKFFLEKSIDYFEEPRKTSLDAIVAAEDYQIAIECKLSESDVGTCSRPKLKAYEKEYCDGTYTVQGQRKERCSLTEIGVRYWKYIPSIFKWTDDTDHLPCPIRYRYQLIRNVLAACTQPDMTASLTYGHAALLYDNRNPAFKKGGKGFKAFEETRAALKDNSRLRKCSWQNLMTILIQDRDFAWLTDELESKYGLKPS